MMMMMMTTMIMMKLMMFLMMMMMILMMMIMMMMMMMLMMMMMILISKIHPFSKIAVTLAPVEENLVYAAISIQMSTTKHGFSLKSGFRKI